MRSELASDVQQVVSTSGVSAAVKTDDSVVNWGRPFNGGDCSADAWPYNHLSSRRNRHGLSHAASHSPNHAPDDCGRARTVLRLLWVWSRHNLRQLSPGWRAY